MAEKRVVGVYPDESTAQQAVALAERAGAVNVVRGGRADYISSLRNEQREQMEHTFVGPGNVGPFTKEETKGMAVWTPAVTVALMIVAVPLAFLPLGTGMSFPAKLAIVEGAAAATGLTVGFLGGLFLGKRGEGDGGFDRQERPLAAEEGLVVGATVEERDVERVADAMAGAGPVRLDVSGLDGAPLATLGTVEDPRQDEAGTSPWKNPEAGR